MIDPVPADLQRLVDRNVRDQIAWYQRHKTTARRLYRSSTVAIIGLGALVPFAATFAGLASKVIVGGAGVAIAVLTAVSASYRWDRSWYVFTLAETELQAALAQWELDVSAAGAPRGDDAATSAHLTTATRELLLRAGQVTANEAKTYFQRGGSDSA